VCVCVLFYVLERRERVGLASFTGQVRKMEQEQHADALVQIICAYPVFFFLKKTRTSSHPHSILMFVSGRRIEEKVRSSVTSMAL
jgi:hypothetical protein